MTTSGPSRTVAALASVALLAAACSGGGNGATPEPTTTSRPATSCPGGLTVPGGTATPGISAPDAGEAPEPGPGFDLVALLPRTGDLAFLGAATTAAAEVAVTHVNDAGGVWGHPVTVHHVDSAEGEPGAAEAGLAAVLDAGAQAVVGPLSSSVAAAALEQVAGAGAIMVTPGATASALDRLDTDGRLFRTVAAEPLQGQALAALVLADGAREIGLVVRDDDHGRTVADAFTEALATGGGTVVHRVDRDPEDPTVDLGPLADPDAVDAVALVGLADTAPVVDALTDAGAGPSDRATYGVDGNLGERLADLVEAPSSLACLRGLLATAPVEGELAQALRDQLGPGAEAADLSLAAETYDAVVALAVAAEAAGPDADGAAIGDALVEATNGREPCDGPATCLDRVRRGLPVELAGSTGPLRFDPTGNRTAVVLTFAAFDRDGHLVRIAPRSVG